MFYLSLDILVLHGRTNYRCNLVQRGVACFVVVVVMVVHYILSFAMA